MTKQKQSIPQKLLPWLEARKKYRLTHVQVQMARELGMNPKKFGSLANHRQEPWKLPLPEFIEQCYQKRFGKSQPDDTRSLEERFATQTSQKTVLKET
ncbi:MAG: hypothetical protein PUP92_35405 [Rhizonema sp. PD38]|nr:hypothetical protein [Rhizonema sp. PD38]